MTDEWYSLSLLRTYLIVHRIWIIGTCITIYVLSINQLNQITCIVPLGTTNDTQNATKKAVTVAIAQACLVVHSRWLSIEPAFLALCLIVFIGSVISFHIVVRNVRSSAKENALVFWSTVSGTVLSLLASFFSLNLAFDQLLIVCDQSRRTVTLVLAILVVSLSFLDFTCLAFLWSATDEQTYSTKRNKDFGDLL